MIVNSNKTNRSKDNTEYLLWRIERLEKRLKKMNQLHLGSNIYLKTNSIDITNEVY